MDEVTERDVQRFWATVDAGSEAIGPVDSWEEMAAAAEAAMAAHPDLRFEVTVARLVGVLTPYAVGETNNTQAVLERLEDALFGLILAAAEADEVAA